MTARLRTVDSGCSYTLTAQTSRGVLAKSSIRQNRYDNWYGYRGGRRIVMFANSATETAEQAARAWLVRELALRTRLAERWTVALPADLLDMPADSVCGVLIAKACAQADDLLDTMHGEQRLQSAVVQATVQFAHVVFYG